MKEYIEREAVLEIVKRTSGDYVAAWSKIAHMPAADVAPVRHGWWVRDDSGVIYCSECGEEHDWDEYRATYCDTCGAKMDGKEDYNEAG